MRFVIPILLLIGVVVAAVRSDDPLPRADIVFVSTGDAFTLDPQRMSYVKDFRLGYAIYEGLLRYNSADMTLEPAAAHLPVVSDDRLTYTFTIRENARWSNGDPVTAHDFAYSWSRLLWPDTAADYSNLFFVIEGAEEFFRWRVKQLAERSVLQPPVHSAEQALELANTQFASVGIKAADDRTLQVKLKQPTPYFLDLTCFAAALAVHRPTVEGWPNAATVPTDSSRGWIAAAIPSWSERQFLKLHPTSGRLEQDHGWARPGLLVSNGPYVLKQWRYKRDLRLERNPHYHSPHIIKNNSVTMLAIEDVNTTVLAYESGAADWLVDVSAEYVPDMVAQSQRGERSNLHAMPMFGTDFYSFNCRPNLADGSPNPFADPKVRRAFAMAVDKEAIVRNITRMNEPVVNTLVPPDSIPGYINQTGLQFSVQKAREEFAAAGWSDRDGDGFVENENGQRFPAIDLLWTTSTPRYRWMSLELKAQWERALGVQVQLRGADTKFYKEDLKLGKFMIARGRWYGDFGDPITFLDISRTGDGNNDRGFSDAKLDRLLDAASREPDPARRMNLLQEAEAYLFTEQMPLVPICQLVQFSMFESERVQGVPRHPRMVGYLWELQSSR